MAYAAPRPSSPGSKSRTREAVGSVTRELRRDGATAEASADNRDVEVAHRERAAAYAEMTSSYLPKAVSQRRASWS